MSRPLSRLKERFDAVLFDLDGTLLDGRAELAPRTARAVADLVDAGLLVVLCTGRSVPGTRRVHEALGLTTPIVAYNGAWIGPPGGPPWRYAPIPDPLVEWVQRVEALAHFSFRHRGDWKYTLVPEGGRRHADHERVAASFESVDVAPAPRVLEDHDRVAAWYQNVVKVRDRAELPAADLMRVSCYFDGHLPPDDAWGRLPAEIRELLHRETFPLAIFPTFQDSELVLLELQGRGRGKAEVFEWLREERGILPERTIAVGDHVNDLAMLQRAGLAVAMENAVDAVRAVAHMTIGHHARDGVARWVEEGAPVAERP